MLSVNKKKYFVWFAAALLAFSAVIKLLTFFSGDPVARAVDPLWGFPNGVLFIISSVAEIAVCVIIVAFPRSRLCTAAIATLGGEFVLYHLFGLAMGVRNPCPCLGGFSSWMQTFLSHAGYAVSRVTLDNLSAAVTWFIALILLSGGIVFHTVGENSPDTPPRRM
jgi:hypothetical protein